VAVKKINNADGMIFQSEKNLKDYGDKIPADTDWEAWESAPDDYEDSVDEEMAKLARRMKADGLAPELITKYTGLTAEEIERL
jgi:hypothetical protein